ncbi:hypothetical protein [Agromyces indicus]|uniref:Uncharacterized protein n=1 Tax=Agromyces indicus TaxID=758919 RepID=A0ABU1FGT1_9MICO|nr:hypothetical protein [Agromyces indicus]MDR5690949.1 hypothetical protein [Agromyces indicus]
MPRKILLPTFRRSTFRAPDPEAAARFDLALPGANVDDDRRAAAELAELDDLRSQSIETALLEQRRLVEDRLAAEAAEDRAAAARRHGLAAEEADTGAVAPGRPQVARSSFVAGPAGERPRHPRHRADRVGNRRPTSGPRRPVVVG